MAENPQAHLLCKLALLAAYLEHRHPDAVEQRAFAEIAWRVGRMDPVDDEVRLRRMVGKIDAAAAKLGAGDAELLLHD